MNHLFKSKPLLYAFYLTLISFIVLLAIGFFMGSWYGTPSSPIKTDPIPKCCSVTLGDSFSINKIIQDTEYKPLWLKYEDSDITVEVLDKNKVLFETDGELILSHNKDTNTFTASGIGEGQITFRSKIDKNVSFSVPFKVNCKSPQTLTIINEQFPNFLSDALLSSEEIAKITSITVNDTLLDAADLAMFPSLKGICLDCGKGIPVITNMKHGWEYFVPTDSYHAVLATSVWTPYEKYIFPKVEKTEKEIEVVFDTMGGEFISTQKFVTNALNKDLYILLTDSGSKLNATEITPLKDGYSFNKWMLYGDKNADISETEFSESTELKGNIKLFADWTEHKYTVKFDMNNGKGYVPSRTLKYTEEYKPDISTVRYEGYDFMGWSKSADGELSFNKDETLVSLSTEDSAEITLYANWRADVYNVRYYDGTELVAEKNNIGYFDSFNIIEYNPQKVGQNFLGWTDSELADEVQYQKGAELSGLTDEYGATVNIYAVWDANKYTVHYNANGGTSAPASQTVRYNENGRIPDDIPTRLGYKFEGWNHSSTADECEYVQGDSYINLSSINGGSYTFYAIWSPDTFNIRFNPTGGNSGKETTESLTFGSPHDITSKRFKKPAFIYPAGRQRPTIQILNISQIILLREMLKPYISKPALLTIKPLTYILFGRL